MSDELLMRLEAKVDKLAEAVERLVRIEERQMSQGERIGNLEQKTGVLEAKEDATSRKLDRWVSYGVGAWFVASIIGFALWQIFITHR